ncbi:MAG: sigma-70 family RNA polymerase sigma factor [Chloroflexi bacterium]|nr:sigma-70 family RNA polymerase sigma factor [Chloroflexota bacterium]MCI0579618.1 sigma-70 family RNA polymerase sigma factor [Chloroflexota bacterium]MCI0644821.1 sigma-70 family RNA polymerase sigma factor [Chloroflexota bacterium]MCI0731453.1 sigma-70 family RNA polymerase sigma factor [Chloroflexota bacterium]
MQDELTLLAGVRKLDPQALAAVHDHYYPAIYRYIAYRVANRETAEDLTSEVFIRLLNAVRDQTAPQNTLRGWLYGVASRVVADHHRRGYRGQEVELSESLESPTADPADAVADRLAYDDLQAAVAELTDEQMDVIALRFGYEMPIRDVAEIIGKSEGAVKQLQARAVAALSRKLRGQRK